MFLNVSATRFNLVTNPVNFDTLQGLVATTWGRTTNVGVSSSLVGTTSPHGLSGTRIFRATNTATTLQCLSTTVTLQPSGYTFAIYLKPVRTSMMSTPPPLSAVVLELINVNKTQGASCTYILSSIGQLSANTLQNYGTTIDSTATITLSTDNWYFCTLTVRNPTSSPVTYYPRITFPLDGNVYGYGAQVELSATFGGHLYRSTVDAASSVVTQNGDAVALWKDKTPNNRHFSTIYESSPLTRRPTWNSSLSCLVFDGVDDTFVSYFDQRYSEQTVFMVTRKRNTTNSALYTQHMGENYPFYVNSTNGSYFNSSAGNLPVQPLYSESSYPVTYGVNVGNAGDPSLVIRNYASRPGNVTFLNRFHTYTSWISGAWIALAADGLYDAIRDSSAYLRYQSITNNTWPVFTSNPRYNSTVHETRLCSHRDVNRVSVAHYPGDMCEVIVYNRALTSVEREEVEYYLFRKWYHLNGLTRTIHAVKNGVLEDGATWNINSEPAPFNSALLERDNLLTNGFQVTANLPKMHFPSYGNAYQRPWMALGGSIILTSNVQEISGYAVGNNHTAPRSFTVYVSSGPNSFVNALSSLVPFGGNAVGVAPYSTINLCPGVYIHQGNGAASWHDQGWSSQPCIITTQNSTISGNRITLEDTNNQNDGNKRRYAIELSGTNNTITLNNSYIRNQVKSTQPAQTIYCGSSTNTINLSGCIISCNEATGNLNVSPNTFFGTAIHINADSILNIKDSTVYGPKQSPQDQTQGCIALTNQAKAYFDNVKLVPYTEFTYTYPHINTVIWVQDSASLAMWLSADNIVPNAQSPSIFSISTSPVSAYTRENVLHHASGKQSIYATKFKLIPVNDPVLYTRQTGREAGTYVYYWTPNATFSLPDPSDVQEGYEYYDQTNGIPVFGTCVLPPADALYYGVFAGSKDNGGYYGTAVFDPDTILTVPLSTTLLSDSIGERIKNTTTNQILSSLVNSWNFA
jgi:hypothetical protein